MNRFTTKLAVVCVLGGVCAILAWQCVYAMIVPRLEEQTQMVDDFRAQRAMYPNDPPNFPESRDAMLMIFAGSAPNREELARRAGGLAPIALVSAQFGEVPPSLWEGVLKGTCAVGLCIAAFTAVVWLSTARGAPSPFQGECGKLVCRTSVRIAMGFCLLGALWAWACYDRKNSWWRNTPTWQDEGLIVGLTLLALSVPLGFSVGRRLKLEQAMAKGFCTSCGYLVGIGGGKQTPCPECGNDWSSPHPRASAIRRIQLGIRIALVIVIAAAFFHQPISVLYPRASLLGDPQARPLAGEYLIRWAGMRPTNEVTALGVRTFIGELRAGKP